jgi:hypothetical protein
MKQEWNKLNLNETTHEKLVHISRVTNISMSRIIEQIIDCMFYLSINYDKATFSCYDRVTEDMVYITIHGYGKKLTVNHFKVDPETSNEQLSELLEQKTLAKIKSDLEEDKNE